jgi:hypothetical protein
VKKQLAKALFSPGEFLQGLLLHGLCLLLAPLEVSIFQLLLFDEEGLEKRRDCAYDTGIW